MSHFSVLVLVKGPVRDTIQAEKLIGPMLKPFDENTEVPEHGEPCYCIGQAAKIRARDAATQRFGTHDEQRISFHDNPEVKQLSERAHQLRFPEDRHERTKEEKNEASALEKELDARWQAHTKPRQDLEEQLLAQQEDKDAPDAECDECHGTGTRMTTYNPQSKWDWYQVGGRWSGMLDPSYDPEKDPANRETCNLCHGTGTRTDLPRQGSTRCNGCNGSGVAVKWPTQWADGRGNFMPVKDIPAEVGPPYAYLTPDKGWIGKGEMGWFAFSDDKHSEEEWEKQWKQIKESYADHTAIVVDCHI